MAISNISSGIRSGVCTSTTRPSAPYEGQMIYETDTDRVLVYNGSAWRYSLTPQSTETGYWTAISSNPFTAFTVGNGSWFGRYTQIGKTVHVQAGFQCGSTSSVGNPFYFDLPVTAHSTYAANYNAVNGFANCRKDGGYFHPTMGVFYSTTQAYFGYFYDQPPIRMQEIFNTGPFTWGTNDRFSCAFTYEAA